MSALIGKSIDHVVNSMDVDAIVSRIDVDKLVKRIDINKVLDNVDMDRLLARIDVNAVLDRIDVERLVERSNLEAIVARSSSGIFQQFLDLIRMRIVYIDIFIQQSSRCSCFKKDVTLPPKLGQKKTNLPPRGGGPKRLMDGNNNGAEGNDEGGFQAPLASILSAKRIMEVQGAYSGVVSKCVAWVCDEGIALVAFVLLCLGIETITRFLKKDPDFEIDGILLAVVYFAWTFHYRLFCLILLRRTVGMIIVGLLLVNNQGRRPNIVQIFIRQLVELCFSIVPIIGVCGIVLAWFRPDGRFLHEWTTCTGVVYSWDVHMARLRLSGRMPKDWLKGEDDEEEGRGGGLYP